MKELAMVILVFMAWFWVQYETAKASPCSVFSDKPSLCNSDIRE